MSKKEKKAPSVFEYLSATSYLKDYYDYRKGLNSGFSYETWSDELGLKSRSFLRMMVIGKKRITEKLVEALCQNNFLTSQEREYFQCLVGYSQSGKSAEKEILGKRLIQIIKLQNKSSIIENPHDLISDPILPRMLSLFSYQDFNPSVENFARIFGLPSESVLRVLTTLEQMGLARKVDEKGTMWASEVITFKIPDRFGSMNMMQFHEVSLNEAIQAFHLPQETRKYKSLLLPMDADEYAKFNRLLDDFVAEQLANFNSKNAVGKRVYQANFNIHPTTEII